ncbi:MAG: hypothetical protein IJ019_04810 [Alphaproteobacteria bacterium]|nr:hypothetical protein [Alphaproteobacteria bacterium]
MEENTAQVTKEDLWYIDNYLVLKDYYDRTISRIAARCIRMGNIAMEEYPFYSYILDVLEEICETGNYIISKPEMYPYVAKKIAGGIDALQENLNVYQQELHNNSSPDMIKQDPSEINKMKEALGEFENTFDPTAGAGMNIDDLMNKLLSENQKDQKQNPESAQQTDQGNQQ